jgi:hypothetical protein
MNQWKFEKGPWKAVPEDMRGYHIWCFTCNDKVGSKKAVRPKHINHEVDWIRDIDGVRYSHA